MSRFPLVTTSQSYLLTNILLISMHFPLVSSYLAQAFMNVFYLQYPVAHADYQIFTHILF